MRSNDDFYNFIADKLREEVGHQNQAERDELQNLIMDAFVRRSSRNEPLSDKLVGHEWIADAIREAQETWSMAHHGNLPTDLLRGENAGNLLNLENVLTGYRLGDFSASNELKR